MAEAFIVDGARTVDRQCGSSQQALQFAAQSVKSGTQDAVIAAVAESMSRVPVCSNIALRQCEVIGNGAITLGHRSGRWGQSWSHHQSMN